MLFSFLELIRISDCLVKLIKIILLTANTMNFNRQDSDDHFEQVAIMIAQRARLISGAFRFR